MVREADDCSGSKMLGGPEKSVEVDLSGRGMAGAAARVVAWSWGTGQRAARWEEQMKEKTLAGRRAEAHGERRSPVTEEGGQA